MWEKVPVKRQRGFMGILVCPYGPTELAFVSLGSYLLSFSQGGLPPSCS